MTTSDLGPNGRQLRLDPANVAFGVVALTLLAVAGGVFGFGIIFIILIGLSSDSDAIVTSVIATAFVFAAGVFVWLARAYTQRNWYIIGPVFLLQIYGIFSISPSHFLIVLTVLDIFATAIGVTCVLRQKFTGGRRTI